MSVQEALEWADKNSQDEVVARMRSRAVAKTLAAEVRRLREELDKAYDYANRQDVRVAEEMKRAEAAEAKLEQYVACPVCGESCDCQCSTQFVTYCECTIEHTSCQHPTAQRCPRIDRRLKQYCESENLEDWG